MGRAWYSVGGAARVKEAGLEENWVWRRGGGAGKPGRQGLEGEGKGLGEEGRHGRRDGGEDWVGRREGKIGEE